MPTTVHFKLKQYKQGLTGDFYIQCKGLHSGKPLRSPIPNCFVVNTDIKHLFELVFAIYKGRLFEPNICGSVVPFIRIAETTDVINSALLNFDFKNVAKLQAIEKMETHINLLTSQIALYKQLQTGICRDLLR